MQPCRVCKRTCEVGRTAYCATGASDLVGDTGERPETGCLPPNALAGERLPFVRMHLEGSPGQRDSSRATAAVS